MLSYDVGKTWSKRSYSLNGTVEYARSIVLEDDTIFTVHDGVGQGERENLCILSLEGAVPRRGRKAWLLYANRGRDRPVVFTATVDDTRKRLSCPHF